MKTYTGIELLQAIKEGEIKSGTNIEVHDLSVLDRLVTTISVNSDRGLAWKTGEFDTSFLLNDYYYFKITDIDIQELKEFKVGDTYIDSLHDAENEIRYLQMGYNNLLKIGKQLDRQINNT